MAYVSRRGLAWWLAIGVFVALVGICLLASSDLAVAGSASLSAPPGVAASVGSMSTLDNRLEGGKTCNPGPCPMKCQRCGPKPK